MFLIYKTFLDKLIHLIFEINFDFFLMYNIIWLKNFYAMQTIKFYFITIISYFRVAVKSARGDKIAQRHFCTRGNFCTGIVFIFILGICKGVAVKFVRAYKIARGGKIARRYFCTKTLLHEQKILLRDIFALVECSFFWTICFFLLSLLPLTLTLGQ